MNTAPTPADVLRAAADAFRTGRFTWGTEWFYEPATGCRCMLGGIAQVADPTDVDGNPYFVISDARAVSRRAAEILADYLVDELGAARCVDTDTEDGVIETVGGWNDEPGRTLAEVIAALEAAADYYPAAVPA